MITLQDYNCKLIRDFTPEQFDSHIQLIKDISSENNFGNTGIQELLDHYLALLLDIKQQSQHGIEQFKLTREQVTLYDLLVELARLCYKHSFETSQKNDWKDEF